jgi:RimJ/RimL family protein N-acetyltransferase
MSDGTVVLRPSDPDDAPILIAGRDVEFHRFLGPGSNDPRPTACIEVDGEIVGWVDYDVGDAWLTPGEVNVGYNVFAGHRGNGYATRAVQLLLRHLAVDTAHHTATLLIDPDNERSIAVARRTGFAPAGEVDGKLHFKRVVRRS